MTKIEFKKYVEDVYNIKFDCPFEDDLDSWVFRHTDNKKWFALVMTIKKNKLGMSDQGYVDVVNMKCAPEIMDDLYSENGVFPAYHMCKKHWLTLTLDGACADETIKFVLKVSHDLTRNKIKARRN